MHYFLPCITLMKNWQFSLFLQHNFILAPLRPSMRFRKLLSLDVTHNSYAEQDLPDVTSWVCSLRGF